MTTPLATNTPPGLTTAEAQARLKQFGPNAVVGERAHPLRLYGNSVLRLDPAALQTLMFATLIFTSQAGVYLLRERGHFWRSRPSGLMLASTALALVVTVLLAWRGLFMPALPPLLLLAVFGAGLVYYAALDWPKVWLFAKLQLR
ncbi:MAG: cation-transporting P-type ATPase [Limisphaerales bacterium]